MPRRKKNGTAISWDRARKLAEISDISLVSEARSFLADTTLSVEVLDGRADKRNKTVRQLIKGFEKWCKPRR